MDKKHDIEAEEPQDLMTEEVDQPEVEETSEPEPQANAKDIIQKIEELRSKLDVAEKQSKEYEDKALYAIAEMENAKRRAQLDVENAHKFGLEKFLCSMIPVMDSLDQALEVKSDASESVAMREGIEMTLKMFIDTVSKAGVVRIDPIGEAFDPNLHEAMSMQENPDHEPDTIIAVFQRGYQLNGRLIRPARVVVSK